MSVRNSRIKFTDGGNEIVIISMPRGSGMSILATLWAAKVKKETGLDVVETTTLNKHCPIDKHGD